MQTRKQSLFETIISTAIGYIVALISQMIIFPALGYDVPVHDNLIIGAFFTVVSIVRGFFVRRFFNWRHK